VGKVKPTQNSWANLDEVRRTTAFSQVHGAVLLSEIISIPLGSALLAVNPWIPVLGALGLLGLTTIITFLSTLNFASYPANKHIFEGEIVATNTLSTLFGKTENRFSQILAKLTGSSPWITKNVLLMLMAFFFCQLSRQFSNVLLQYSSFKFNWDYAKVTTSKPHVADSCTETNMRTH
jgi:hypothetical protein